MARPVLALVKALYPDPAIFQQDLETEIDATQANAQFFRQDPLAKARGLLQTAKNCELDFLLETSGSMERGYGAQVKTGGDSGTLPPHRFTNSRRDCRGLTGRSSCGPLPRRFSYHVRRLNGLSHIALSLVLSRRRLPPWLHLPPVRCSTGLMQDSHHSARRNRLAAQPDDHYAPSPTTRHCALRLPIVGNRRKVGPYSKSSVKAPHAPNPSP